MGNPLIPQAFWFRLALPCRRVDGLPRSSGRGRLLDLPEACALPDLAPLDGRPSWASVRVAWNPGGLAVAVEIAGQAATTDPDPDRPHAPDTVQVWVDTRDTRDVHRATRFCHRFVATLVRSGSGPALGVEVAQKAIPRALAEAPAGPPEAPQARAERLRKGWRLELFFPAEALHGFDPETNRRLGFAYLVTDPDRGDQYLAVGREFPVGEDPSLWATLELRDEA